MKYTNLKRFFPLGILFALISVVVIANFKPATYLSGWDNLHSEFNFGINIKRSFFAVWQEYQGLGLLGGMGHAADLPRQIVLLLTSFILPSQFLRYFYHFLMLYMGGFGMYFLLKKVVFGRVEEMNEIGSIIGAIFYVFNLATLQMFYVPFEPYSTHFGLLPWLFLGNILYLKRGDKKSLLYLFLINIAAIPQGYIATFFLVYFFCLSILFFQFLWKRQFIKRIVLAYVLLFVVNAFWLLPNLYFVFKKVNVNTEAKINLMSTEDIYLRNKKYGDLADTTILKGFWFDNQELDVFGVRQNQMGVWVPYLNNPIIRAIGYLLFVIVLIGIFYSLKKKMKDAILFIPIFFFCFIILSTDTPILSFFSNLFYKLPIFGQIFRFTFTKYAILTAFNFSIFYAIGSIFIFILLRSILKRKEILYIFAFFPLMYLFPLFSGHLFYDKTRAKIPPEYFQLFDYFKTSNQTGRIANFPQNTFWGWTFYRWNYSGSGFLWYGIEQPILDRAFDVWSREDENYYNEISYALYSGNSSLFNSVLEKYQIQWLVTDANVISPESPKALALDKLEFIIRQSEKTHLIKNFNTIKVYKVELDARPKSFIFLAKDLPSVLSTPKWNNYDRAFRENTYYTSNVDSNTPGYFYYPFSTLFTGRKEEELNFKIEDKGLYFSFNTHLPKELAGSNLIIPSFTNDEIVEIDENGLEIQNKKIPEIFLDGEIIPINFPENKQEQQQSLSIHLPYIRNGDLEVHVPKIRGYYSYDSERNNDLYKSNSKSCSGDGHGDFSLDHLEKNGENTLQFTSIDSSSCVDFDLPYLTQRLSYLISIKNSYVMGKSLLFGVINKNYQRSDIETYLPQITTRGQLSIPSYFIIPPMEQYGLGYTLHFDNVSIGRVKTMNKLGPIMVNPIPFHFLAGIKIEQGNSQSKPTLNAPSFSVSHQNTGYYEVSFNKQNLTDNTVILSQSFDVGWHAYQITNDWFIDSWYMKLLIPFFQPEIKKHILVNNWENGWELANSDNTSETIVIIYLPQYLEYFGFFLFIVGGIMFVRK